MKNLKITLLFALLSSFTFAQSSSECNWGIRDVSILGGSYSTNNVPSIVNFHDWFPNSRYLAEQANWNNDFRLGKKNTGSQTSLGATIFQSPLKFSANSMHQIRVSAVFGTSDLFAGSNSNETVLYHDTLSSSRGIEVSYTKYLEEKISVNASYKYVGANIDYRLLFNADGRWSFYGGVGAFFGATYGVNSQVDKRSYTSYKSESNSELDVNEYPKSKNDKSQNSSEVYAISSGSSYGFHLPIGINFRIGKNREFWRSWSLTFDMNNQFYQVANLPDDLFSYRMMNSLGVKYTF